MNMKIARMIVLCFLWLSCAAGEKLDCFDVLPIPAYPKVALMAAKNGRVHVSVFRGERKPEDYLRIFGTSGLAEGFDRLFNDAVASSIKTIQLSASCPKGEFLITFEFLIQGTQSAKDLGCSDQECPLVAAIGSKRIVIFGRRPKLEID